MTQFGSNIMVEANLLGLPKLIEQFFLAAVDAAHRGDKGYLWQTPLLNPLKLALNARFWPINPELPLSLFPELGHNGFGRGVVDIEEFGCLNKKGGTFLIVVFPLMMRLRKVFLMVKVILLYFL